MSKRTTKKARSESDAIARASEEAPVTRNGHYGEGHHIGYSVPCRVDHLTPKARKALGRRMFD